MKQVSAMNWRAIAALGCTLLSLIGHNGCMSSRIGGPTAPASDPAAGTLSLPGGRSVGVYPDKLAYTGQASYRWPDGREYTGNWVAGKPEGYGTESSRNGEVYRGGWQAGKRHGRGELDLANGARYVGNFAAGLRQGHGEERTPGGLYRGEWQNDLQNGRGEYFGRDGSHYRGEWRDGTREGRGTYLSSAGDRYQGDWADGAPNGFGLLENADGSTYYGGWRNNKRDGYGRLHAAVNLIYEGTWLGGKRHGYGLLKRPDGSSYLGEWRSGNRHGQGRERFPDGRYHDGGWENNQAFGPGTRRREAGIEITGVWNGDLVANGILRLPGGAEYAGRLFSQRNTRVAPRLITWLEGKASAGKPVAQYLLATVYTDFAEPPPDPARARTYFSSAAAAGIAEAQYRLALLTLPERPVEGVRLLTRAAATGYASASARLGEMYATGAHVARDTSVATTYLSQASERGNLGARNNLAWIYATYPDPMLRNGAEALSLIKPIALLYQKWQHLDTLAAAYAETGDFANAIITQRQVIALAQDEAAAGTTIDPQQFDSLGMRLSLYEEGRPFRESGADE